ncbi:MAG: antitoxin of toxin-antitoxin stability system [Rhodospirillales bacterium]|nr:antitoxin of toxin-antitoxin stability system [Rhodospirillales bacterium]
MPRIIETVVYTVDELADATKEPARAWYRETGLHDEWTDFVCEDFRAICRILGVELATIPVKLMGGGTRDAPQICFRGFHSQGDGASFAGSYRYARGAARGIRTHAPEDKELYRIADELQQAQRRNFYRLTSDIRQRGNYSHEYSMAIEVERHSPTWQPGTDGAEDAVIEALGDLARWLYRQLCSEFEHLTLDEVIDATIAANELTFTAEGRRFG